MMKEKKLPWVKTNQIINLNNLHPNKVSLKLGFQRFLKEVSENFHKIKHNVMCKQFKYKKQRKKYNKRVYFKEFL